MAYATFNDLVNAIIQTESSGRANARGKAGELGLMQIQPNTAERYGIKDPRMLLDPSINRAVGARILGDLLKRYKGNVGRALDAYNAGEGKADKGVVPASTRDYIGKVLSKLSGAIGPASADAAEFAPVKDKAQAKRMGAIGGAGLAPVVGAVDEIPMMLRQALNEGRLTSDAATGLNRAARAGLLNPGHVREILKMADPQAAPAATGSKTPGMFVDEGAGTRAMRLVGQGAGALGVARKVGEQFGEDIKSGLKRAGGAIGNAAQGLLEGTAEAAEPSGSVKELPSVYGRAEGVPIPTGASIGKPSATVPIPAGASIGKPPSKPAAKPLPLLVRGADVLPFAGQLGGEMLGGALSSETGPGAIIGAGVGGGLGEAAGEEIDTGARALAGQPYKSQAEILKDAGISGAVSAAGVPIGKALGKVGEVIAPSSLKAALAARGAYRASREALDATMKKLSDLLGLDAKAAAVAAASPIESREARAAYFAGKNLSFNQASQVYQDIGKSYVGRMTPNASAAAYSNLSNKYGARSLPLLDNGIDFTRPTWRMIQQFRGNVRRMMRHLPEDSGHMASDLRKLEQTATKDLKAIMTPEDARRLDLIDQHFHDLSNQFPASQANAIASAPNASKAMAALVKSEPSQAQTLLRGIDNLPPASRDKAIAALRRSVAEWIHEEGASGGDYVQKLAKYDTALNQIPAPAMNRLFGAGSREQMHEALQATIRFHRRMLKEPNLITAVKAEMDRKPLPWIVRHGRWVAFGAIAGFATGRATGNEALGLVIGFTPEVMHVLLNNPLLRGLYLKAVTAQSPAAIAAGLRALLTAAASEQIRGPIPDPETHVTAEP